MGYALISSAAILFSLQFLFQNNYKKIYGSGVKDGLNFQMYVSLIGAAIIFIISLIVEKKPLGFSPFTLATAFVYAVITISFSVISLKAMQTANVALFSTFAMLGGMVIPFLYGVIANGEAVNAKKIAGLTLIAAALIVSALKKESENKSKKAYLYYAAVFLLNGAFGAISAFHQSPAFSELAAGGYALMVYAQLFAFILSALALAAIKGGAQKPSAKILQITSLYAAFNGVGNLFTVLALLTIPASVQYPVITGGTIIISSAIAMISEKKFMIKYAVTALISLAATILFVA